MVIFNTGILIITQLSPVPKPEKLYKSEETLNKIMDSSFTEIYLITMTILSGKVTVIETQEYSMRGGRSNDKLFFIEP